MYLSRINEGYEYYSTSFRIESKVCLNNNVEGKSESFPN